MTGQSRQCELVSPETDRTDRLISISACLISKRRVR